jgi:hypothetical protein
MLPFLYGVVTSSSSASSPSGPWVAPVLVCRLVVTLRAQRVLQNQPFVHWAPRSSQKKHSSSSPKKATCMLVGKHCRERAEKICVYINEHKDSDNIVPRFVRREPIRASTLRLTTLFKWPQMGQVWSCLRQVPASRKAQYSQDDALLMLKHKLMNPTALPSTTDQAIGLVAREVSSSRC